MCDNRRAFARRLGAGHIQAPTDFHSVARDLLEKDVARDGADDALVDTYYPDVRGAPPAFFEKHPNGRL